MFREFKTESPDYNLMIEEVDMDKIAADRSVLCIMTEFSLMNNRMMSEDEFVAFLMRVQMSSYRNVTEKK